MTDPILFSIVVPTYNRAHLISGTVESILSQTYKHFELIIVDDGSTDNTEEVMSKYLADNVHYYKKANGERAAARNYGAQMSKGDYVNWFDSDDLMFPNHLEEAAKMVEKYNRPEIFAQGHQHQDTSGRLIEIFKYPENINDVLYKGNPIANSPVIVRRDIAIANPFNEDRELSGSEDYELWLRIGAQYHIYSSDVVTVGFVHHDERSTILMSNNTTLINRYNKLNQYATADKRVVAMLGDKLNFFQMKNFLLLAVDLSVNGHKQQSRKYLSQSFKYSWKVIFQRGFYAFLKHTVFNAFS
jgi:glycosyltransferase involved in cell wall biosynthesis